MKKLSEYRNEEALDLLADIIDPIAEIFGDTEVSKHLKAGGKKTMAVSAAIKHHKRSVFELMARLNGKSPEEYECGVLALPALLLEVINDKDMLDFFVSQEQIAEAAPSGTATETTQEIEEE